MTIPGVDWVRGQAGTEIPGTLSLSACCDFSRNGLRHIGHIVAVGQMDIVTLGKMSKMIERPRG